MTNDAEPIDPALRVVSDTFLQQLERLLELEERKRQTPVDDEGFAALARAVEDGARVLLERAQAQTSLADQAHLDAVITGESATIAEIPSDLTPSGILSLWREAEHELEVTEPGTTRHRELTARVQALRGAYQVAYRRQA